MDLDQLLAPIAGASPCGEDMSFSMEFDQIAELRRQDDPTLDQGAWVTALKVADWPGVIELCSGLLAQRTKDLRLAMWLTEAWAITEGFQGLDRGLQLCSGLCERFWAELHPQADGSDLEERVGNMGWLLQRIEALSQHLPITKGRQGAAFNLQDLAAARQFQNLLERQPEEAARQAADKVTLEQFNRSLRETPANALLDILQAARQSETHLLGWQSLTDAHLGADGPSFVQAKEALADAVHQIERLAREAGALSASGSSTDASSMVEDDATELSTALAGGIVAAGPIRSRAQALQQLREVASYFRRTEPHSPVAYLADKAVKWGDMPLHEWLRQVIKDQGSMSHLQELLGLEDDSRSQF
jgi:type VI secretion system protein ImpA